MSRCLRNQIEESIGEQTHGRAISTTLQSAQFIQVSDRFQLIVSCEEVTKLNEIKVATLMSSGAGAVVSWFFWENLYGILSGIGVIILALTITGAVKVAFSESQQQTSISRKAMSVRQMDEAPSDTAVSTIAEPNS